MRWSIRVLTPLFAVAMLFATASYAEAQAPPNRFFGTATLNGSPAPSGTPVLAFIGSMQCGSGMVGADGRYVVDVANSATTPNCGTDGATITFRVGGVQAGQTATYNTGTFTELALVAPGTPMMPSGERFNEAFLNLDDPRPCMPAPCDANRTALWNGDAAAWAARGVTGDDARFGEIIVLRVQAGEPSVIRNIARILGNPYLQITRLHFAGSGAEFLEITNLGGGPQDMTGWIVRARERGGVARFPDGFTMAPGQSCRFYTSAVMNDSCGTASFMGSDVWVDDGGVAILFYEALALPGAERRYVAAANAQPAEPDLQGVN
jgi:hypothetical protein